MITCIILAGQIFIMSPIDILKIPNEGIFTAGERVNGTVWTKTESPNLGITSKNIAGSLDEVKYAMENCKAVPE